MDAMKIETNIIPKHSFSAYGYTRNRFMRNFNSIYSNRIPISHISIKKYKLLLSFRMLFSKYYHIIFTFFIM